MLESKTRYIDEVGADSSLLSEVPIGCLLRSIGKCGTSSVYGVYKNKELKWKIEEYKQVTYK